ncbi:hypothetical protein IEQ34_022391 [Dendrobium chrysotoxum]|uniref:Uncharacterized protein n=1 Tax=Dendrobium chrysotoxum TaxID=161865 RepID=A0AAV7FWZ5_DENCH|nr:hypothetical protein IEQ34_022391 [Dendrobium chrysotoxum]
MGYRPPIRVHARYCSVPLSTARYRSVLLGTTRYNNARYRSVNARYRSVNARYRSVLLGTTRYNNAQYRSVHAWYCSVHARYCSVHARYHSVPLGIARRVGIRVRVIYVLLNFLLEAFTSWALAASKDLGEINPTLELRINCILRIVHMQGMYANVGVVMSYEGYRKGSIEKVKNIMHTNNPRYVSPPDWLKYCTSDKQKINPNGRGVGLFVLLNNKDKHILKRLGSFHVHLIAKKISKKKRAIVARAVTHVTLNPTARRTAVGQTRSFPSPNHKPLLSPAAGNSPASPPARRRCRLLRPPPPPPPHLHH